MKNPALGANNVFANNMALHLNGGTFVTNGYSDVLGQLNRTAASTIDYSGVAGSILSFSSTTGNAALTIDNWIGDLSGGGDSRFRVTSTSAPGNLSNIHFLGWGTGAQLVGSSGNWEIVPNMNGFYRWDGNGQSSDEWRSNRGQPWVGNSAPPNSTAGTKVYFGEDAPGPTQEVRITSQGSSNRTVGTMVVGSEGGPDYSFRSNSNNSNRTLIFNNGSGNTAYLTIVGDGQHVIGSNSSARVNIRLDANTRISNNSTGNIGLTIGQSNHTFNTNGNTATFTGSGTTLVDSVIQGSGGVTIDSTGVVRLANTNTHSGGTVLQKGTLQIANNQALGTGTFNINGGNIQAYGTNRTIANTYNINNSYTVSGSNNMTFSGTGTVGAGTHTINVDGVTHTYSGGLGGTGGLIMDGTGVLEFTGNNKTFSGGLTVNDGTVNASRGGNITLGATDASNNIAGTGDITVNSGGTFNLTQTSNNAITLRGGSTLANNGGTLNITSTGNNENRDFFIGTGTSNTGHLVSTGGTTNISVGDDIRVQANSSITVSGGTVNLNPADAFYTEGTSGNAANINVSDSGSLNIDITGARSDNNQITIGQHDNLNVTGPYANATFTGQNNSTINLNGKITLSDQGTLTVANGHTNLGGSATLDGGTAANKGTLVLNDSNLTLSNATSIANAPNVTFNLSDGQSKTLNGATPGTSIENLGTLALNGADDAVLTFDSNINNVQAQKIIINGGTLMHSSNDQIENDTSMELAGGTWHTAGYSEVLGTLTLSANSNLDLGAGASVIHFADSSSETWSSDDVLIIRNWSGNQEGGGTDQIIFGNSNQSLSSEQLGKIYFYNPTGMPSGYYAAMILENGEIVPIPEPSTWLAGGALLGLLLSFERKRLGQWFRCLGV